MYTIVMHRYIKEEIYLDELLNNLFCSKKTVYLLKQENRIKVNNKQVKENILLNENDIIDIDIIKDETNDIEETYFNLDILYEDDYLLIVNKPIGVIIHDDNSTDALDNYVAYYYRSTNQRHKVYHVHRLDKDTSGAILYCKQAYLLPLLDKMLQEKKIQRTYLALASGNISKKMTINKPIGSDRHHNNRYVISSTGKEAITQVEPLKRFGKNTLVKCKLKTGRTHQIRVHLASISHPIVGDTIYGNIPAERLMLHSCSITLTHPITNERLEIVCPVTFPI